MKKLLILLYLTIIGLSIFEQPAQAILFVDVLDNGSNQSRWIFSGSDIAETNGAINGSINQWLDLSDYVDSSINDVNFTSFIFNNVTISNNTDTRNINSLYIDDDNIGAPGDDFGIGIDGTLSFLENDTINWSGEIIVNADFNALIPGTHIPTDSSPGNLDLQLNVGSASVPFEFSPSIGIILSIGLFSAHQSWKKVRSQRMIN